MRGDGVLKEVRHLARSHRRIDVREIRQHLATPVIEDVQGHRVVIVHQGTIVFIEADDRE